MIRAAAVRLFAARGYGATGVREIAREAGLTSAALYHHLGSKQELLFQLMEDAMLGLIEHARASVAAATTPPEELAALARSLVVYNGERPLEAMVTDAEIRSLDRGNRALIVKLRDDYELLWAAAIRRGVERGDFDIADQKVFRLSAIQMCNGTVYWYSPAGERSLEELGESLASLTLAMACCRRPPLHAVDEEEPER